MAVALLDERLRRLELLCSVRLWDNNWHGPFVLPWEFILVTVVFPSVRFARFWSAFILCDGGEECSWLLQCSFESCQPCKQPAVAFCTGT